MPWRFAVAVILILGTALGPSVCASDLKPQSRMAIVRGLIAEFASAKTPLPRGEKGLFLKTDGQIDQERLRREITQHGTAVQPNVLIQITKIEFRDKEIAIEINGGGKKKTKWYERVEVGIGSGTTPISTGNKTSVTVEPVGVPCLLPVEMGVVP